MMKWKKKKKKSKNQKKNFKKLKNKKNKPKKWLINLIMIMKPRIRLFQNQKNKSLNINYSKTK